jgi:hypothetical protein
MTHDRRVLCEGRQRFVIGDGVEVGVGREAEALLEVGIAQRAERTVVRNGFALAFPSGSVNEVGCGLLQHVGDESGTFGVDAIVGYSPDGFRQGDLHGVHVFGEWQVQCRVDAATACARSFEAASAEVEMEVTVFLIFECGRTTEDAIFLEMVTGRNWHNALQKLG